MLKTKIRIKDRRRRDILRHLSRWRKEYLYSPTQEEIAKAAGFAGASSAAYYLKSLREEGLVTWQDGGYRTLAITPAGEKALIDLDYRIGQAEAREQELTKA